MNLILPVGSTWLKSPKKEWKLLTLCELPGHWCKIVSKSRLQMILWSSELKLSNNNVAIGTRYMCYEFYVSVKKSMVKNIILGNTRNVLWNIRIYCLVLSSPLEIEILSALVKYPEKRKLNFSRSVLFHVKSLYQIFCERLYINFNVLLIHQSKLFGTI